MWDCQGKKGAYRNESETFAAQAFIALRRICEPAGIFIHRNGGTNGPVDCSAGAGWRAFASRKLSFG